MSTRGAALLVGLFTILSSVGCSADTEADNEKSAMIDASDSQIGPPRLCTDDDEHCSTFGKPKTVWQFAMLAAGEYTEGIGSREQKELAEKIVELNGWQKYRDLTLIEANQWYVDPRVPEGYEKIDH